MSTRLDFDIYARDRASRTFDDVGDSSSRAGSKVRAFGRIMGTAALGVGAAGVVAGAGLFKLAQGAAEDEQAAKKLAVSLRNAAGATEAQTASVEDWISAQGVALGVTDDELRPALGKLVVATKDVGDAQRLTGLAMNVSAGTGKSLEAVTTALAKAQGGTLTALNKLQPGLVDAKDKTMTLDKATAALATTYKGQASSAADTTAGKYARLKLQLSEAGEAIGYKLLPYGVKLADWLLSKGIPGAEKFATAAKEKLGAAIAYVSDLFGSSSKKVGGLGDAMDDGKRIVENAKRAWEGLSPLLDKAARTILPMMLQQFKTSVKVIGAMSDAAIFLYDNAIGPSLKASTGAFAKLLDGVGRTLSVLGSVPGAPKWISRVADDAGAASYKLQGISDAIKRIPDSKNVSVKALTDDARTALNSIRDYKIPDKTFKVRASTNANLAEAVTNRGKGKTSSAKAPSGHSADDLMAVPNSAREALDRVKKTAAGWKVNLGPAGADMLAGLVQGIKRGKKPLGDALKAVRQQLDTSTKDLASRLQTAQEALANAKGAVVSDFKGWQSSIFNATAADDQPLTVDAVLAYAQTEAAKAASVKDAVAKLAGPGGLSQDLLRQLQGSGSSGYDTLRLLASASSDQVAQFNALNKQTGDDYAAAGGSVANRFYGQGTSAEEMSVAAIQQESLSALNRMVDLLERLGDVDVSPEPLELKVSDTSLVATQKKRNRQRGKKN